MTTQEIIEGNKLIAEFMQVRNDFSDIYYLPEFGHYFNSYGQIEWNECFRSNELKFNSSWDWLMPVVEKIEKTKQADVIIHAKNLVQISYNKETKAYFYDSLLENVWLACIEFIKWYNQNK